MCAWEIRDRDVGKKCDEILIAEGSERRSSAPSCLASVWILEHHTLRLFLSMSFAPYSATYYITLLRKPMIEDGKPGTGTSSFLLRTYESSGRSNQPGRRTSRFCTKSNENENGNESACLFYGGVYCVVGELYVLFPLLVPHLFLLFFLQLTSVLSLDST